MLFRSGAKVGEPKNVGKGITVLGRNLTVSDKVTVSGGKIIDKDVKEDI